MTDQEINAAIAEACGWLWDFKDNREVYWMHKAKPFRAYAAPPDYVHDLNAMHEALSTLTEKTQRKLFVLELNCLVNPPHPTQSDEHWNLIAAKPRALAEAFIRAFGKWKEPNATAQLEPSK